MGKIEKKSTVQESKGNGHQAVKSNPSSIQLMDNRMDNLLQRKLSSVFNSSPSPIVIQKIEKQEEEIQMKKYEEGESVSNGVGSGKRENLGFDPEASDQKNVDNNGLPHQLKSGIESLSGISLDDVKVHYNSQVPAQLQAHAFAQGSEIHIAPGQENHLPHEAWHVVQQKQGRVKPTRQLKGKFNLNEDESLEKEADQMGAKSLSQSNQGTRVDGGNNQKISSNGYGKLGDSNSGSILQRKVIARIRTRRLSHDLPRVISELRIEGRAPTTVKNAQGDHTVAETLINESVKREVIGQQPKIALNNLMVLARLTLGEEAVSEINNDFFSKYWDVIDNMEGEDRNTVIEEMIQRYIELANKRESTAFLRDEELTRGNKGERKAIGGVRDLADKLQGGGQVIQSDLVAIAKHLSVLIDIKFYPEQIDRYSALVGRAMAHAVLSVLPQLSREHIVFLLERLLGNELGVRDKINPNYQKEIFKSVLSDIFS